MKGCLRKDHQLLLLKQAPMLPGLVNAMAFEATILLEYCMI